jgi:hypothetical protein
VLDAVDAVFDAHLAVAAARFVAVALYDGCFIPPWSCSTRATSTGAFRGSPAAHRVGRETAATTSGRSSATTGRCT